MGNDENSRRIIESRMGELYFPSIVEQTQRIDKFLDKTPIQMVNGALGVIKAELQDGSLHGEAKSIG